MEDTGVPSMCVVGKNEHACRSCGQAHSYDNPLCIWGTHPDPPFQGGLGWVYFFTIRAE